MFTIEDAIEKCKDRAEISKIHHMLTQAAEWEQIAKWLEALWCAPDTIRVHSFKYAVYYPDENIFDMRDRQREVIIEEAAELMEELSKEG